MRVLLTLLLVAAMAFAGCTGAEDPPSDDLQVPEDEAPAPPAPPAELPRMQGLAIGADNLTGEAPLAITFTLEADAPAPNATWGLYETGIDNSTGNATEELLAEGLGLPATLQHTFEAGEHNLVLRASDGDHAETEATITINVEPAAEVPQVPTGPQETILIEDSITGLPEQGDKNTHAFELVSVPSKMTLTFTQGATAIDLDFILFDPAGGRVDGRATFECAPVVLGDGSCVEAPIVVEDAAQLKQLGEWTIEVVGYVAVEGEYTITIDFE